MKTIALEIRHRATFIPVMATLMEADNSSQAYLLRRAGYAAGSNLVMLAWMGGGVKAEYDAYNWSVRTMQEAHKYIQENFGALIDGDVIDVEFILGEVPTKKVSEKESAS